MDPNYRGRSYLSARWRSQLMFERRALKRRIRSLEIKTEQQVVALCAKDRDIVHRGRIIKELESEVAFWKREYERCASILDEVGPKA